ncbi:hypothetical protein ABPG74_008412 [Tetrahymena malaccensis]
MEKDKCDTQNKNQLNLIDYLNKKQGQEQKSNFVDQDSSLENNLSINSENDDDNSQKNLSEFKFDHPVNQNTKIHKNQCMQDKKSNKKEKSSHSSDKKFQSNKKSKITQSNKKATGMNYFSTNDRNAFKKNTFQDGEGEEEETKDSTEQSKTKNKRSSVFDSNEDKMENEFNEDKDQDQDGNSEGEDDEGYQTIDDDEATNNYSNNDQNPNQSNPRSNSEIIMESENQQYQRDQQRSHGNNSLPPLQSLFPEINQNMSSLSTQLSNFRNPRILFSLPYRTRHGLGLSLLDQLNNAHQRARNNRARRDLQRRQNSHQYNEIYNEFPSQSLEIQPTESTENQLKQLICARISSIIIYFVLIYFMRNSNKFFTILATIILIIIQFYIYTKKKQLEQIRGSQIHENRYFSYRLSDTNNNQINENNQVFQSDINPFQRFERRPFRRTGLENYIRELNQVLLIDTFFRIINQFQQQAGQAGEPGYTDQQLVQIGGTNKYSELKKQLKLDKKFNADNNDAEADTQNLEEDENQCIVCLENFNNDDNVRILKCQHYFHQTCVDEWLKTKKDCPVCRQSPLIIENSAENASANADSNISIQNSFNIQSQTNPMIRNFSQRNRGSNMDVFLYQLQ